MLSGTIMKVDPTEIGINEDISLFLLQSEIINTTTTVGTFIHILLPL